MKALLGKEKLETLTTTGKYNPHACTPTADDILICTLLINATKSNSMIFLTLFQKILNQFGS